MAEPEDAKPVEETEETPQEKRERRAATIRLFGAIVDLMRLGWEAFTHRW